MTENTSTGGLLLAFAAGAAAGAIAALLLAPRNGAENRALIARTASGAKEVVSRVPDAVCEAGDAGRRAFTTTASE
jgi:gas vesicle protein